MTDTEELKQKAINRIKETTLVLKDKSDTEIMAMCHVRVEDYIAGATEATKELQEQIEKLNKELEEYKNIDKRLICNHKYFTSDMKNNNLAVICHSILSCDMCGRWEKK